MYCLLISIFISLFPCSYWMKYTRTFEWLNRHIFPSFLLFLLLFIYVLLCIGEANCPFSGMETISSSDLFSICRDIQIEHDHRIVFILFFLRYHSILFSSDSPSFLDLWLYLYLSDDSRRIPDRCLPILGLVLPQVLRKNLLFLELRGLSICRPHFSFPCSYVSPLLYPFLLLFHYSTFFLEVYSTCSSHFRFPFSIFTIRLWWCGWIS